MEESIKVCNLGEKREEFILNGYSNTVNSGCFNPSGKLLASGSDAIVLQFECEWKREEFEIVYLLF